MTSLEQEQIEVAAKRAVTLLEVASAKALAVVEKAAANGVATSLEVKGYSKSINRTTWGAMGAGVLAILGLLTYLLGPIIKEQDRQAGVLIEAQKDIRELYRVGSTAHSDRLEAPVPTP